MISSRDDLLKAIRVAPLTVTGLTVGPVAFVEGRSICFGKVIDETTRRALLTRVKLASSASFKPDVIWSMPCLEKTKSRKQSGTIPAPRKKPGRAKALR